MNDSEIYDSIEKLYEADEHQKIIDLILSLPENKTTPDIISELGRAYNNMIWEVENQDDKINYLNKAKDVLESVSTELKGNDKWHYRIAYTYFYLNDADKAKYHFQESENLSGENYAIFYNAIELAKQTSVTLEEAYNEIWEKEIEYEGQSAYYSVEEIETLESFIEENFGKYDSVFHELISPDIHCDIFVIKPSPERDYYTLITGGMGAYNMEIPDGFSGSPRSELIINLPSNWEISNDNEEWYWPLRWLKILARLPIEQNTFLGWGHTVPTGDFLEGTNFDCFILLGTLNKNGEGVELKLPSGELVSFYTIFPLYPEETLYKLDHNADGLLEKFDDAGLSYPPIVDKTRINTCQGYETQPNEYLLDNVAWAFNNKPYDSLMSFVVDVKEYNEKLNNDLSELNPFATIFKSTTVKLMYEAFIKTKDEINDSESLLLAEETFSQTPQNGYYHARIIATLQSSQENVFGSLQLLLEVHNTLFNKELGGYNNFKGFEIQGYEEDGTPVIYLLLDSEF